MQTSSRGNARLNEYHPAFEEYCEAIFELHEDDVAVIQARIAERLDVSRPAVSEMVHKMADEGLLTVNRGKIALSVEGMKLAEQVVRRHRLAERFLTDVLGLSWALAHQEAGKWEHVISTPVEDAMAKLLGDPTTCPHGNPIPGSDCRSWQSATASRSPASPRSWSLPRACSSFSKVTSCCPERSARWWRSPPTGRPPFRSTTTRWASDRSPPSASW